MKGDRLLAIPSVALASAPACYDDYTLASAPVFTGGFLARLAVVSDFSALGYGAHANATLGGRFAPTPNPGCFPRGFLSSHSSFYAFRAAKNERPADVIASFTTTGRLRCQDGGAS